MLQSGKNKIKNTICTCNDLLSTVACVGRAFFDFNILTCRESSLNFIGNLLCGNGKIFLLSFLEI